MSACVQIKRGGNENSQRNGANLHVPQHVVLRRRWSCRAACDSRESQRKRLLSMLAAWVSL